MTIKSKKVKTNWQTTDNRFVGFLDILGFKDLVMRKPHSVIYDQLTSISKTKQGLEKITEDKKNIEVFGNAGIYIVNFSDSIVLFSKNDDIDNLQYFILALRILFSKSIENGIPLKGGIAHGEISVNKSEQIYFGQAIIDAYLIEEDVDYFGIVAHNSIDAYIETHKEIIDASDIYRFIFEDFIPLKSGRIKHRNINWFTKAFTLGSVLDKEAVIQSIKSSIEKFKNTVSGSPRRYIDNTIEVLEKIDFDRILKKNKK